MGIGMFNTREQNGHIVIKFVAFFVPCIYSLASQEKNLKKTQAHEFDATLAYHIARFDAIATSCGSDNLRVTEQAARWIMTGVCH